MMEAKPSPDGSEEASFDPTNWEKFRALAHQMVDDMIDYTQGIPNRPVWLPMPQAVRETFSDGIPFEPLGEEEAYAQFLQNVMPYTNGNVHPRFLGWVQGTGTPLGAMADMLAAMINPHMAGFNQAPALAEHQVLRWFAELMEWPIDASGLLVSGGSVANLIGMTVARNSKARGIREEGLQSERPRLICYCSSETHSWINRTVEVLGLGQQSLHKIPVDENYRMVLPDLSQAIEDDKAQGRRPFCVVASAGTVNTGATDDLENIAEICRANDLWFHVDGAFGALAKLAPSYRHLVIGIEQADSLAFDLHKWGYLPYEIGCILIRDGKLHEDALQLGGKYLKPADRGVMAGGIPFAQRGLELTRGFKALKAWMSLKAYGVEKLSLLIEQNIRQAQGLAKLIEANEDLQLLAPVPLNVLCFRFARSKKDLNALNRELLFRMQEAGAFVVSSTELHGDFALRAAIVNHRTTSSNLEDLLHETIRIGREIDEDPAFG